MEEKPSAREKVTPISERMAREERVVEKLQPVGEPKSWRDTVKLAVATGK